jgi:hypothetical protein
MHSDVAPVLDYFAVAGFIVDSILDSFCENFNTSAGEAAESAPTNTISTWCLIFLSAAL